MSALDPPTPGTALAAAARTFGPGAAAAKLLALAAAESAARTGVLSPDAADEIRRTLDFVRAYPDDARVLRAVRAVLAALPPAPPVVHPFFLGTARRLVAIRPRAAEIEWDEMDDEIALSGVMELLATSAETPGVLDPDLPLRDWFARCRPAEFPTDLSYLVAMLDASGLPRMLLAHLWDQCALPIRWNGPPSCDVLLECGPPSPQRGPLDRERFPLEPEIRRPLPRQRPLAPKDGQRVIDTAIEALAARRLEIFSLVSANPADVVVVDGGGGLRVAFAGVLPEFRDALETHGFFLVTKNGAPLGYGPVGAFLGCCEMGINLFPEFRGAEIRRVWALVMRAMHHVYGIEHFFLTRYGMGEGNPEAIESGAFWFYRKLGFVPAVARVDALAREEETRMAADPSYRSSPAMLRRLAHTEAHFDLSGGRRKPFPFAALAVAVSRFVGREFGADRALAARTCSARVSKHVPVRRDVSALAGLAPVLAMIPDLARWPARDRAALARIVEAKSAPHEARAARLLCGHARLEAALRSLAKG